MADPDVDALRAAANAAADNYYEALDEFYNTHLPTACNLATTNVTDVRLAQVEADLRKLTARLNSSPSLGIFLLDLAMAFVPVLAGHLVEAGLKKLGAKLITFRGIVAGDRRWQMAKAEELHRELTRIRARAASIPQELDLKTSEELFRKYQNIHNQIFTIAPIKPIETKADFEKAFRSAIGEPQGRFFEYSTPVINDYFQAMGSKLIEYGKNRSEQPLRMFANKPESKLFDEYYNDIARTRFGKQPNAMFTFMIGEICQRQKESNASSRQFARYVSIMNSSKDFLRHEQVHYNELHARLPRGSDLTEFKLVMSEKFEAAVWLMFLGDPKDWFATRDPKTGEYYQVPPTGYVNREPGYFRIHRKLPDVIVQHLLDAFHPALMYGNPQNFRDYYRLMKADAAKGYSRGAPTYPNKPAEDIHSPYGAEDTAIANVQKYFVALYSEMKGLEPYFSDIMARHSI